MEKTQCGTISSAVREKLIVALDYDTLDQAAALVEQLGDSVTVYKAGLEIFLRTKGAIVDYLHGKNKKVFLDLKFHDITNTVVQACLFAAEQNVFMFNVHCSNRFSEHLHRRNGLNQFKRTRLTTLLRSCRRCQNNRRSDGGCCQQCRFTGYCLFRAGGWHY